MMASPSELSLDCKPQSYSILLKSFGELQADQTQKLEDFLARLEEERLKIDVFKRELPLCMQLLTNAVEASRQQLQTFRANQGPRPVLEEFIPIKKSSSERSEKASNLSDMANWMTSAQLWSQASDGTKQQSTETSPEIGFSVGSNLALDNKHRNGGAFLPFSKERNSPSPTMRALSDLALASPEKGIEEKKCSEMDNGIACTRKENAGGKPATAKNEQGQGGNVAAADSQTATVTTTNTTQTHRKARRCWSPDLHRRFVNALQMLGGSQVATPKQIRELMKVDGLTNDEVKSHLQKYRLHTRRPIPTPQAAGTPAPQLVVLGGIWVPPEYATAAAAAHGGAPQTLYSAHPPTHTAPPHYVPHEFYPAPPPAGAHHQFHPHAFHHPLHMYKASSQPHSSPESDIPGVGDRSESIEDGKSESGSWKGGDSGGGGEERKGLGTLLGEGEESNGSEIALKF
ncbi:myb family transcription factor EFM-like [Diospyros lotus]|uniref:myb family transcription factor EFM-like n=1 Tax=Diospyros lotus TaxID=55363 RepID=UPI0022526C8C|nr:myb family transcription factor EFM-like [Diospyros lotus]